MLSPLETLEMFMSAILTHPCGSIRQLAGFRSAPWKERRGLVRLIIDPPSSRAIRPYAPRWTTPLACSAARPSRMLMA